VFPLRPQLSNERRTQRSTLLFEISGYGTSRPSSVSRYQADPGDTSDGEGFIVVYSVTSRSTFARVERIVERIIRVKEDPSSSNSTSINDPYRHSPSTSRRRRVPIVIVGNKKDKYQEREVSTEEAKGLAQGLGCDFYETSAKTNINVEAAYKSLVRSIKAARGRPEEVTNGVGGGGGVSGGKQKKKRCVVL